MPVLSARAQAQRKDSDGNTVQLTPAAALQAAGPRLQITLSPLEVHLKALADKGESPPQPVAGWGLIDTGASGTCVDQTAATRAGLAVVDSGPMSSATHDNHVVPIFAGRIDIGGIPQNIDTMRAYGASLEPQGLIALIGRDVLTQCVLIYNGVDGSYSLSI